MLLGNLGNSSSLLLELLLVSFGLLSLGLSFLELGTLLSELFDQEFVLSLDSVCLLSGDQKTGKEESSEEEATDRVPDKGISGDNTEREDTPPVHGVANPESEEATDDLDVVNACVLVDTLIVSGVDWIISVTISGDLGGLSLSSSCVDSVRLHH